MYNDKVDPKYSRTWRQLKQEEAERRQFWRKAAIIAGTVMLVAIASVGLCYLLAALARPY